MAGTGATTVAHGATLAVTGAAATILERQIINDGNITVTNAANRTPSPDPPRPGGGVTGASYASPMTTRTELQDIAQRARRVDDRSWDLALTRHHDPEVGHYAAEVHVLALDTMELVERLCGLAGPVVARSSPAGG